MTAPLWCNRSFLTFLSFSPFFMENFKLFMWNCQGVAGKRFLVTIIDLCYLHKPNLVVLAETWLSGTQADIVCKNISFSGIE